VAKCAVQRRVTVVVDEGEQRPPLLVRPAAVLQQCGDGVGLPAARCNVQRRGAVVVDGREQRPPLLVRPAAVLQQCGDDADTDAAHVRPQAAHCAVQRRGPLAVDGTEQRRRCRPLLDRAAAVLQQRVDGACLASKRCTVQRCVPLVVGREQRPAPLARVLQQRGDGTVATRRRRNVQRRVTDVVDGRDQRPPLPLLMPLTVRAATMRTQQRDDGVDPPNTCSAATCNAVFP
jgi:hypothetical protein